MISPSVANTSAKTFRYAESASGTDSVIPILVRASAREFIVLTQLHPWLVPHSVQTPQAPARMTLSLPQTEQVMPMKILPSAIVTRYDDMPVPLPFPSDAPPFPEFEG